MRRPIVRALADRRSRGARSRSCQTPRSMSPRCAGAADPRAEGAQNVRLVGYNDLQGRESLVVTTKSDPANGNWVYVGHHESFWDGKPKLNPITGKMEWNGTSILENSTIPRTRNSCGTSRTTRTGIRAASRWSTTTSSMASGHDYLIRNSEVLTEGETGTGPQVPDLRHHIARHRPLEDLARVGDHRDAAELVRPGMRRQIHHARAQRLVVAGHRLFLRGVRRAGVPQRRHPDLRFEESAASRSSSDAHGSRAQKDGEPGYEGQYAHHPIVDEVNKRLYVGYRNAGQAAAFDIADPGEAETGLVDRHEPAASRSAHGVADRLRQGSELRQASRCRGSTRSSSTKPAAPPT